MRPCQAQEKMQPPVQQRDELDREYDARVLSLSYAFICSIIVHSLTHVATTRIADIQTFIIFAIQSTLSLPEVGKKKHKAKKPKD